VSVSVLIVNFRTYDELACCLDSLLPWLERDDEVIVVDYVPDPVALARIRAHHPEARFITESVNLGFAAGVNEAARLARGKYLLVLNPDTLVPGPVPKALAAWLDGHSDIAVAGPRIENDDGSVQPSARRFPGASTLLGGRSTWLTRHFPNNWFTRRNLVAREAVSDARVDWVSGACLMTRAVVFKLVGGFDEGFFLYWEDADYCRRVAQTGSGVAFVPSVTVRHTAGRSARHDVGRAIRAFHRSAFRLYWKHTGGFGRLAAPIVWLVLKARAEKRVMQSRVSEAIGKR
jgi:N-acetylglucosaminyl-diphospho-decaprenol L-rhamnosyltransferase